MLCAKYRYSRYIFEIWDKNMKINKNKKTDFNQKLILKDGRIIVSVWDFEITKPF
jgi:hypothetical protein